MPRFSANLSTLWQELDVYDRFCAAADAGFRLCEILFVHELDLERLTSTLRESQLKLVLFDVAPGQWSEGERGLLAVPGREDEFRDGVSRGIAWARHLGTDRLNVLAGNRPDDVLPDDSRRTALSNLEAVVPLAQQAGVRLLLEAINDVDMPGYALSNIREAAELVAATGSRYVRLQLDQYHVAMSGDDPLEAFRCFQPLIEHIQIADIPGRHQPGTGNQDISAFLAGLDQLGYEGAVGLEYIPRGTTEESLAWLPRAWRA